jgi:hypothetical protein
MEVRRSDYGMSWKSATIAPARLREAFVGNRTTLLLSIAVALVVFFLNRNATSEYNIFTDHHIRFSQALLGDIDRSLVSYPMWGYPLTIVAFGSGIWLKLLQLTLSLAAFLWVYRTWVYESQISVIRVGVLILFAWVWFSTASVYWPAAIAVPIWWISLTLYKRLITTGFSSLTATFTGITAGIAANFRSEFLFFTLLVLVTATLVGTFNSQRPDSVDKIKSLTTVVAVTLIMLLPWGIFNQTSGEGFRLTSSNSGAVATISLGQLPGNSWGITPKDDFLVTYLEQGGGETTSPFNPNSDRLFWKLFIDSVIDNPGEYVKKMLWNLKNSLLGGLYVGDIDTFGGVSNSETIDNWKESLKSKLGLNSNPNTDSGSADSTGVLSFQFLLFVAGVTLSAATALLVSVAILALILKSKIKGSRNPNVMAVATIIGALFLVATFQYQPRSLNVAAPAFILLALPVIDFASGLVWNSRLLKSANAKFTSVRHRSSEITGVD